MTWHYEKPTNDWKEMRLNSVLSLICRPAKSRHVDEGWAVDGGPGQGSILAQQEEGGREEERLRPRAEGGGAQRRGDFFNLPFYPLFPFLIDFHNPHFLNYDCLQIGVEHREHICWHTEGLARRWEESTEVIANWWSNLWRTQSIFEVGNSPWAGLWVRDRTEWSR